MVYTTGARCCALQGVSHANGAKTFGPRPVNAVHTVTQADEAAEDSTRSPGDLLPALGSVPLGMITRALSRERHPVIGVDDVDVTPRCAAAAVGTVTTLCGVFIGSCTLTI
jgi:hypothetical protein